MRNLCVLALVLLCSLQLISSFPLAMDFIRPCCSNLTKIRIPLKHIISYWSTSSSCANRAIVFQTVRNGKKNLICVDPSAPWVDHHIKKLNK
ncbi:eotaxin-like [Hoplias malabaricus]|uniref:eotaxin-like n=1 Tax=Hoplias malabaricus TaxID=27720 RepID=UPI003461C489